jgi:hypothetical protein
LARRESQKARTGSLQGDAEKNELSIISRCKSFDHIYTFPLPHEPFNDYVSTTKFINFPRCINSEELSIVPLGWRQEHSPKLLTFAPN